MSLYATPPFADMDEDERNRRHAQLMYLMGIGAPSTPTGPAIDPRISFWAPLVTTLVPTVAGNPAFTFSRASLGYVRDHENILRLAPNGGARFQGARRVRNLVAGNSGNISAWTKDGAPTITFGTLGPTGLADANTFTATAANDAAYNFPSTTGTFVNSIWLRRRTGTGRVDILQPNAVHINITAQLDGTWRRFSAGPNAISGNVFVGFSVVVAGDAVDVAYAQIEDVSGQSNQAPGDYVSVGVLASPWHGAGVDGVKCFATTNGNSVAANIVTEATGTLIPAATLLGMVAENAATNLCLQSQTFDNATWSKSDCTITPNTQAAPDGTLTADRYTDNATNSFHVIQNVSFTFTAATYTGSFYAKAGTLPWVQLTLYDSTGHKWANFNLVTGAVGNKAAGVTASVQTLPNGWFRFSVTATTIANAGVFTVCSLPSDINAATPSYVGTGQTMFLWGAQVETGSDPSSYVATTTVAVVRAADSLTYPIVTNLLVAVGTMYAEVYTSPIAGNTLGIMRAVTSNSLATYFQNSGLPLRFFSAGGALLTANGRNLTSVNKVAAAYDGVTASADMNGAAVATGAFTAPVDTGNVIIGGGGGVGEALRGTIRNVKFYNVRIADADLVTMTGP